MDRTQIIRAVQVRIDDVVTDNSIEVISNPIIDQILDEQLSNAFRILPIRFLPKSTITGTPTEVQSGLYKLSLPSDYMRLVRFKTNNLLRPLTEFDLVSEGSQDNVFMYHPYVSGGNARPKGCVISGTTQQLLYNSTATGTVEDSWYVAFPTPEDVTETILDPVAWFIASAALTILGDSAGATNAMNKVTEFINLNQI